MNLIRRFAFLASALFVLTCLPAIASACPMCNQSIQEDKSLPMAYQASIVFMLATPFTVLGGLGGLICYKFRQHEKAFRAAYALQMTQPPATPETGHRGLRI
ncbi:MAG: hypothetical protein NT069_11235 [Planctomycetota bacterium]|nr:hypothetical protein [Planctomycetota bacterium]